MMVGDAPTIDQGNARRDGDVARDRRRADHVGYGCPGLAVVGTADAAALGGALVHDLIAIRFS